MRIRDTIWRALAGLVLRAESDKVKFTCSNPQLCSAMEAVIYGVTHTVRRKRE